MNVLIADDHPMFRVALRHALMEHHEHFRITEVPSQGALEAAILGEAFDLALVDLMMPGATGFSSLVYLRCERPELPVIVISSAEDPRTLRRAQQFGAAAFVPKSASAEQMNQAVDAVLEGGQWFPPQKAEPREADARLARRLAELTPQELRVLLRIADGLPNKQVAADLSLSENTIRNHVSAILKKLNCNSRTQATLLVKTIALDGGSLHEEDT